jgi:hypothetical protein
MKGSMSLQPSSIYRPSSRLTALVAFASALAFTPLSAQKLTPVAPLPTVLAVQDSLKADSARANKRVTRADTARVVMHSFNHKQQLITGGAIMATMVSIMVVMNNYNPRIPQ